MLKKLNHGSIVQEKLNERNSEPPNSTLEINGTTLKLSVHEQGSYTRTVVGLYLKHTVMCETI